MWKLTRALSILVLVFIMTACASASEHGSTAPENGPQIGDVVNVWAVCRTREAALLLSFHMQESGLQGYVRVMRDPNVQCVDTRIHGLRPSTVTLVEYEWRVTIPTGESFDFWKVASGDGGTRWSWRTVDEPAPNQENDDRTIIKRDRSSYGI